MPKYSDRVFQTFSEITEGVIERAPEVETLATGSRQLIVTPEGLRSIRAENMAEVKGVPGPPGPPGPIGPPGAKARSVAVFEQESEPQEAQTGDYWIQP